MNAMAGVDGPKDVEGRDASSGWRRGRRLNEERIEQTEGPTSVSINGNITAIAREVVYS